MSASALALSVSLSLAAQSGPATSAPSSPPPAPAAPAAAGQADPQAPLQEAARIVEVKANTVKNLKRALSLYDEGLQAQGLTKKQRATALIDMARARLRLGDLHKGKKSKIKHYEAGKKLAARAQKLDKRNADAFFWEAANLASIGRTNGVTSSLFMLDELKAKLYKALELNPRHHYAKETIASIYHAVPGILGGSDSKAERLFREILKADPNFTPTKVTYAKFLIDNGEDDKARKLLREVINTKRSSVPNDFRKFNRPDAKATLARLDS